VHFSQRPRSLASRLIETIMVGFVRGVFALSRALGPERSGAVGAALARWIGPLLRAHRTALANIRAAYPGMPDARVRALARAAWDNLGRTGGEYPHLGTLFDFDPDRAAPGRTEVDGIEHFLSLRDDGKPGLVFSAHLANWELPAICAARFGLDTTAVFRAPNDPAIARVLHEIRSGTMGNLEAARQGAAFAMQGALEKGGHLGMLIDQHFTRGVIVTFMGRPALVNPVLGKFARRFDCPVHGVRVIRLPGHRFRLQLTPPLDLPRDPDGQVNVQGAMQAMTLVVEGWVREHPEQWLWMHRRWRAPAGAQNLAQGVAQANVSSQ
jgi:Kdo2-lipid IVA lauroyltransferase/acyltransferase